MSARRLVFLETFETDIDSHAAFYNGRRIGLGAAFAKEVSAGIEFVAQWPESCNEVELGVRRKWLNRFPHSIVYRIEDEAIIFIGILHGAQDFETWLGNRPVS